jgi:hypothetical protein
MFPDGWRRNGGISMNKTITRVLLGVSVPLALVTAAIAAEKATDKPADPMAACSTMMQGAGVTEEGKKAMQEFMQSPRAPEAMADMMAMARRMGNGDVLVGMTRMMEMMGSMGSGR